MLNDGNNVRRVGIPDGQTAQRGDGIKTLNHFEPVQTFAVQFADDEGQLRNTVVMRIGGQWYLPPNGEAWSRALQPLKEGTWLERQLTESFSLKATPLPKSDAVDILGKTG
jgi:hypothetical protein